MGMEWQMVSELIEDQDAVEKWLERGYEPFAVGPDAEGKSAVWLKKMAFTERDEPRSSAHPENANRAGNELDLG